MLTGDSEEIEIKDSSKTDENTGVENLMEMETVVGVEDEDTITKLMLMQSVEEDEYFKEDK